MEVDSKIYILDDKKEKFMGLGVLWLLQKIGEGNSLRSAAQSMELSYSKAYGMISHLEETLGRPVLERKKGGQSRGGVVLTDFARSYMALYDDFQTRAKAAVQKEYAPFEAAVKALMEE